MKILNSIFINPAERRPKQQCCIYYLSKHEDTDIEYVNKDQLSAAEAALEKIKSGRYSQEKIIDLAGKALESTGGHNG
jgi:hypothetical protein